VPDIDAAVDALCAAGLARAVPPPAARAAAADDVDDGWGNFAADSDDSGAESADEAEDRCARYTVLSAPELRSAAAAAGAARRGRNGDGNGGTRAAALEALVAAASGGGAAAAEAAWTAAASRACRLTGAFCVACSLHDCCDFALTRHWQLLRERRCVARSCCSFSLRAPI
jgi:hypothetical protein